MFMDQLKDSLNHKRERFRLSIRRQQVKLSLAKLRHANVPKSNLDYEVINSSMSEMLESKSLGSLLIAIQQLNTSPHNVSSLLQHHVLGLFLSVIRHNCYQGQDLLEQETPDSFQLPNQALRNSIVTEILMLLTRTQYDSQQGVSAVIQGLWGLLGSDVYSYVKLALVVLTKSLKDMPNCHQFLLSKGLVKEIYEFVKEQAIYDGVVLDLIGNHLKLIARGREQSQEQSLVLNCTNSPQYNYFLTYAISIFCQHSKYTASCLQVIKHLLQIVPSFANCLHEETVESIINQILNPNLEISQHSLQILDSLSYSCQISILQTLMGYNIIDVLDRQLYREDTCSDANQVHRITKITFILCNLFCIKNFKILASVRSHFILDHIFSYIQPDHRLIRTSRVFDYYFGCNKWMGRNQKVMDAFLEAVSLIDFQTEQGEMLKEIVKGMYIQETDDNRNSNDWIDSKLEGLKLGWIIDEL